MRILLAGSPHNTAFTHLEIGAYASIGYSVVVNDFFWPLEAKEFERSRFASCPRVTFGTFNPTVGDTLKEQIAADGEGFDALVCPTGVTGLNDGIMHFAASAALKRRLKAIGCPNDSTSHLGNAPAEASKYGIPVIHTPSVHARAVAEFTISQIGFHSRRIADCYEATGRDGAWPHHQSASRGQLLYGKTLGVIGGSGRDGSAVISLAKLYGLDVLAIGSGARAGLDTMRDLGADVAQDIDDLVRRSDFLSINCRPTAATEGLIGASHFRIMKPGLIAVNPSAAEIFNKEDLIQEFSMPIDQRRLRILILDMPYGKRRDEGAFASDPDNDLLRRLGVHFTPRIAGYTMETQHQAEMILVNYVERFLSAGDRTVPISNLKATETRHEKEAPPQDQFLNDLIEVAQQAAAEVLRIRESGLHTQYKQDGSPVTNADLAAEMIIRDGLRARNHEFRFSGEERRESAQRGDKLEVVVDGIDGTRNFRDGNYGWCISIGVLKSGATYLAVIFDPECRQLYFAIRGGGAFIRANQVTHRVIMPRKLPNDFSFSIGSFRVSGSTAIKGQIVERIKELGGRGREWGSVALSICAVARGGLGAFLQANSKVHDHIAAILFAAEAGASVVLRPDSGSDSTDVIVAHPELASKILDIFDSETRHLSRPTTRADMHIPLPDE